MVVEVGSFPWSEMPRRIEKKGRAIRTTTTRATIAGRIGRLRMKSAHFGQNPLLPAPTIRGPLAARLRRCFLLMTRGPMNERNAGSRVSAASMVNDTPMAAAIARP